MEGLPFFHTFPCLAPRQPLASIRARKGGRVARPEVLRRAWAWRVPTPTPFGVPQGVPLKPSSKNRALDLTLALRARSRRRKSLPKAADEPPTAGDGEQHGQCRRA